MNQDTTPDSTQQAAQQASPMANLLAALRKHTNTRGRNRPGERRPKTRGAFGKARWNRGVTGEMAKPVKPESDTRAA